MSGTQASAQTTLLALPADIPFINDLGVELLSMRDGHAEVALDLLPRHMNSWEVTHGGVSMTLLDLVMAMACRSLYPAARAAVTVEMSTTFMQPGGKAGGRLRGIGKALHRSTTMCFCEGEIWDGDKLVAKAMGTFKYLKRLDVSNKLKHTS